MDLIRITLAQNTLVIGGFSYAKQSAITKSSTDQRSCRYHGYFQIKYL